MDTHGRIIPKLYYTSLRNSNGDETHEIRIAGETRGDENVTGHIRATTRDALLTRSITRTSNSASRQVSRRFTQRGSNSRQPRSIDLRTLSHNYTRPPRNMRRDIGHDQIETLYRHDYEERKHVANKLGQRWSIASKTRISYTSHKAFLVFPVHRYMQR